MYDGVNFRRGISAARVRLRIKTAVFHMREAEAQDRRSGGLRGEARADVAHELERGGKLASHVEGAGARLADGDVGRLLRRVRAALVALCCRGAFWGRSPTYSCECVC